MCDLIGKIQKQGWRMLWIWYSVAEFFFLMEWERIYCLSCCWLTWHAVGYSIFMGHFKVNSKFLLRLWFLGDFLFFRNLPSLWISTQVYLWNGNSYISFFWIRPLLHYRVKETNLLIFLVESENRLRNPADLSLCRIYFAVWKDLPITIFLPYFEVFFH